MRTVDEIFTALCHIAPLELQMGFDNSGFLVGHGDAVVQKALLALDVTNPVIDEAIEQKAGLIITHHPVIFHARKAITDQDVDGAKLLKLIENRIAVISMHTNLDIAEGGVNDVLMERLGARSEGSLDEDGCGRMGQMLKPMPLKAFLYICKQTLGTNSLRYHDACKPVSRLAVMGGAGGDSLQLAFALGCDTYVTADIKYHQFLEAAELGLNLIDADHFCTENPVIPVLRERLSQEFSDIEFIVSQTHHQVIQAI